MISIIVAGVVLWLLPTILRGFVFGLLVVGAVLALHVVLLAAVALAQQQTRTTCYDSFPARICETFDGMGNIISKSRCYRSGDETRCDTQTFGGHGAERQRAEIRRPGRGMAIFPAERGPPAALRSLPGADLRQGIASPTSTNRSSTTNHLRCRTGQFGDAEPAYAGP